MTARCTICGRYWNVSVKKDVRQYICPWCDWKRRVKNGKKLSDIARELYEKRMRRQVSLKWAMRAIRWLILAEARKGEREASFRRSRLPVNFWDVWYFHRYPSVYHEKIRDELIKEGFEIEKVGFYTDIKW